MPGKGQTSSRTERITGQGAYAHAHLLLKHIVGRLIVERYDHALVLRETPENHAALEAMRGTYTKIIVTPYQPTCENMVEDFARAIAAELPAGVELFSVKLHETATSFAEWYASDNL